MPTAVDYKPDDLAILARLEPRHFWFRARQRIILDALARWFPQSRSYLEIGCGTGFIVRAIAEAFPAWRIVASDPLAQGIHMAGQANRQIGHTAAPDMTLLRIDARHIPFRNQFDVIGAYDVLEHICEDEAVLRELWQACVPGGGVLLTVPQHAWLWSRADDLASHQRRYSVAALRTRVAAAGFRVIGCSSFNSINLPFVFMRSRFLRTTGLAPEASVPPAPLNWILERSMDIDRFLIRAGFNLPVGGSLLLAARRLK